MPKTKLKLYRVERVEVSRSVYNVEAPSEAEALRLVDDPRGGRWWPFGRPIRSRLNR